MKAGQQFEEQHQAEEESLWAQLLSLTWQFLQGLLELLQLAWEAVVGISGPGVQAKKNDDFGHRGGPRGPKRRAAPHGPYIPVMAVGAHSPKATHGAKRASHPHANKAKHSSHWHPPRHPQPPSAAADAATGATAAAAAAAGAAAAAAARGQPLLPSLPSSLLPGLQSPPPAAQTSFGATASRGEWYGGAGPPEPSQGVPLGERLGYQSPSGPLSPRHSSHHNPQPLKPPQPSQLLLLSLQEAPEPGPPPRPLGRPGSAVPSRPAGSGACGSLFRHEPFPLRAASGFAQQQQQHHPHHLLHPGEEPAPRLAPLRTTSLPLAAPHPALAALRRGEPLPPSPPPAASAAAAVAGGAGGGGGGMVMGGGAWGPGCPSIDYAELELGELVGEGGFAKVFRGRWRGEEVAVKQLNPESASTPSVLDEFRREVAVLASLAPHPNIVRLVGACCAPPHRLAVVTQYCGGGSLYALLHSPHARLSWGRLVSICLGVARGMRFLHSQGFLHRDLKSGNLLLDLDGCVKLADFGLSRMAQQAGPMTGGLGTYQWMAPEVLGHQRYSQKADVYSFAMVMWECSARQIPYTGMDGVQAALAVMSRGLRPEIPPHTPPPFARLMAACWAPTPDQRPDFGVVVAALERMAEEVLQQQQQRQEREVEEQQRWLQPRREHGAGVCDAV